MKRIEPIIRDMNNLTFPELIFEINKLGLQNISTYAIGNKERIYRARPTEKEKFNHVSQLSYNPWPKFIDRASTPCSPMFYGCISANSNDYPMLTNFAELNQVLRCKSNDFNEQEIAIAEFETISYFNSAALIFCKPFLKKNIQYQELYNKIKEISKNDFEILEDFSYLFSFTENEKNHDNRLTAAISYYILDTFDSIEAILYPSTRLEGEGTNIAIHPVTARSKLKCKKVVVTKIYMQNKCVINDYNSIAETINPDGSFELRNITEPPLHLGRDYCLEKLNEMVEKKEKK